MTNPEVTAFPNGAIRQAVELFPTPFFLYDEAKIRQNCRRFAEAFRKHFPKYAPLYAVKANTNPEILKVIFSEGWGADCSSEAEAWITKELDGWGQYTGNYNPEDELRFALEMGDAAQPRRRDALAGRRTHRGAGVSVVPRQSRHREGRHGEPRLRRRRCEVRNRRRRGRRRVSQSVGSRSEALRHPHDDREQRARGRLLPPSSPRAFSRSPARSTESSASSSSA